MKEPVPATAEFEAIMKQIAEVSGDVEFAVKFHVKYVQDSVPPSLTMLESNIRGYLSGLGFKVQGISVRTGSHV